MSGDRKSRIIFRTSAAWVLSELLYFIFYPDLADALLVGEGPVISVRRTQIVDFAAKNRLPAMYPTRPYVDSGGLMSYNAKPGEPRWAVYIDKILKGRKPADLPVELPTEFDFVINLKTAKALGLTIPQSVLAQATEVVQ